MHLKAPLTVLAPAKINLFLHITGKRDDGYHTLESLVSFADIGDTVRIKPASSLAFSIDGPFARGFTAAERDSSAQSANLVIKAAHKLAQIVDMPLDFDIRLTKNLPLAAGIGGGSSDAAALIWGLLDIWDIDPGTLPGFDDLLLALGADMPACMTCASVYMRGIGEQIEDAYGLPEIPVVLVNPNERCPTNEIFARFTGPFSRPLDDDDGRDLTNPFPFLKRQRNDLSAAAIQYCPTISKILEFLNEQDECAVARLSGSGATCFGLFSDDMAALDAATTLAQNNPGWWVCTGTLNRVQRY